MFLLAVPVGVIYSGFALVHELLSTQMLRMGSLLAKVVEMDEWGGQKKKPYAKRIPFEDHLNG